MFGTDTKDIDLLIEHEDYRPYTTKVAGKLPHAQKGETYKYEVKLTNNTCLWKVNGRVYSLFNWENGQIANNGYFGFNRTYYGNFNIDNFVITHMAPEERNQGLNITAATFQLPPLQVTEI